MDLNALLPVFVALLGGAGIPALLRFGRQNRVDDASAAKSTLEGMQLLLNARDGALTRAENRVSQLEKQIDVLQEDLERARVDVHRLHRAIDYLREREDRLYDARQERHDRHPA